ncbi:MAG: protein-disulfide reductase DsbD family protein [Dehalococcoidia bacterium]|nr:protein-disulfide reductase DsbD family protein [Dehalococcoidia bacterium]
MRRVPILVRFDLDEGLHLYGEPIPDGYIATTVEVAAPEGIETAATTAPPTHRFRMEGLDETFHVFEGRVEFEVPVWTTVREGGPFALDVTVRFQACDDRQCFLPQTRTLRVEARLEPLVKAAPAE